MTRVIVVAWLLGLIPACGSCPVPNCPTDLDLLAACTKDGSCSVDAASATCSQGQLGCALAGLNAGSTLVISLAPRRTTLGTRDDLTLLYVGTNDPPIAFSTVELFFDGAPAACECGRFGCTCANVPTTVANISLKPKIGVLPSFMATFADEDCRVRFLMTAKPCPV